MNAVLVALAVLGGVHDNLSPRQFQIEVVVCKGDPLGSKAGGTVRHLMDSSLTVFNGQTLTLQAEHNELIKGPDGKLKAKPFGVKLAFSPARQADGKIWIEATTTYSETQRRRGLPGFTESSSRTARMVTTGEKFRVEIAADGPDSQTWAEVTVSEVPRGK